MIPRNEAKWKQQLSRLSVGESVNKFPYTSAREYHRAGKLMNLDKGLSCKTVMLSKREARKNTFTIA